MGFDQQLADRIRAALAGRIDADEKRMFGGLAFSIEGHMAVCASSTGGLMVRIDPADGEALLAGDGVQRMVMGGREMAGWLLIDQTALDDDAALAAWVARGVAFVQTLPPK